MEVCNNLKFVLTTKIITYVVVHNFSFPRLIWISYTQIQSLGWENLLEKEMATHSSILARKIPWVEEPDRLQSMGLQRVVKQGYLLQVEMLGIKLALSLGRRKRKNGYDGEEEMSFFHIFMW